MSSTARQEVYHEMGNLMSNETFASSGDGDLPRGWEAVIPNPHLGPEFDGILGEVARQSGRLGCENTQ